MQATEMARKKKQRKRGQVKNKKILRAKESITRKKKK